MKTKKKANQVKRKKFMCGDVDVSDQIRTVPMFETKEEKALTKSELVKLYEEFKEKKKAEFDQELRDYFMSEIDTLRHEVESIAESSMLTDIFKVFCLKDFYRIIRGIKKERPTYTEPTFNEFMESLGEKKGYDDYGDNITTEEWNELERNWKKRLNSLLTTN